MKAEIQLMPQWSNRLVSLNIQKIKININLVNMQLISF